MEFLICFKAIVEICGMKEGVGDERKISVIIEEKHKRGFCIIVF